MTRGRERRQEEEEVQGEVAAGEEEEEEEEEEEVVEAEVSEAEVEVGGWAGRRHVFVISSCSDLSSACWRSSSRSFFHLSSFCSSFCCSCSASQTFSTFLRLAVCHDFLERKESDLRQGAASAGCG